jgi:hypothetical protein
MLHCMLYFVQLVLSSEVIITSVVKKLPPTLIEYEGPSVRSQKPTTETRLQRLNPAHALKTYIHTRASTHARTQDGM